MRYSRVIVAVWIGGASLASAAPVAVASSVTAAGDAQASPALTGARSAAVASRGLPGDFEDSSALDTEDEIHARAPVTHKKHRTAGRSQRKVEKGERQESWEDRKDGLPTTKEERRNQHEQEHETHNKQVREQRTQEKARRREKSRKAKH